MSLLDTSIYDLCLDHHGKARNLDFVVPNGIPIPYFGDVAEYKRSSLRVLTAALNPSDEEFPAGTPRFDVARALKGADELEAELSAYFKANPYRGWFRSFEPLLNGLGASYGGKMADGEYRHTVLHLDMCSPIATSPTWSKLASDKRLKLTATGREAFEQLVDALKPDIIIASLAWGHIEGWHADFRAGRNWESVVTYASAFYGPRLRRPLQVQANELTSRGGHKYLFVNGNAANTPFGQFHNKRKLEVGRVLLRCLGKIE